VRLTTRYLGSAQRSCEWPEPPPTLSQPQQRGDVPPTATRPVPRPVRMRRDTERHRKAQGSSALLQRATCAAPCSGERTRCRPQKHTFGAHSFAPQSTMRPISKAWPPGRPASQQTGRGAVVARADLLTLLRTTRPRAQARLLAPHDRPRRRVHRHAREAATPRRGAAVLRGELAPARLTPLGVASGAQLSLGGAVAIRFARREPPCREWPRCARARRVDAPAPCAAASCWGCRASG
jgi:hypothetical protein